MENKRVIPWHSPFAIDVSECTSSADVIKKAGLDYDVRKCELVAQMPLGIKANNDVNPLMGDFVQNNAVYRVCPNAYATYRRDTNMPLGIVKSKYEVVQNIDAFDFFDKAIENGDATWDTAGLFGYGEKVFISAKLPKSTLVGKNDYIENYLVLSNSHDGTSSITIMFTPVRIACFNVLNAALTKSSSYITLRHTRSVKERMDLAAEIIQISMMYSNKAGELYNCLNEVEMSDEGILKYIMTLFLTEDEHAKLLNVPYTPIIQIYNRLLAKDYLTMERSGISTKKANKIDQVYTYYLNGIGQKEIHNTAWGAYNAITGYCSNVLDLDGAKRMDNLLYGTSSNLTLKALNLAFDNIKKVA